MRLPLGLTEHQHTFDYRSVYVKGALDRHLDGWIAKDVQSDGGPAEEQQDMTILPLLKPGINAQPTAFR
jgi:hypothetical protein